MLKCNNHRIFRRDLEHHLADLNHTMGKGSSNSQTITQHSEDVRHDHMIRFNEFFGHVCRTISH